MTLSSQVMKTSKPGDPTVLSLFLGSHMIFFRNFSQTFNLNLPAAVSVHCSYYFLLVERLWLHQIINSFPAVVGCYHTEQAYLSQLLLGASVL